MIIEAFSQVINQSHYQRRTFQYFDFLSPRASKQGTFSIIATGTMTITMQQSRTCIKEAT